MWIYVLCSRDKFVELCNIIDQMLQVGALEGDEELTPLGHHLAKLPVDVLIGKV